MNPESHKPSLPPLVGGTLYMVATPIGNLEDMTPRALRTLRESDVVAAEDTRRAGMLLQRFGMHRPLISYHRFNEARRSEEILVRLGRGEKVALITDAGVPGISDPGERIAAAAVQAGFRVESVPGACAVITALAASGLPTAEFHFAGFLPHKSGQRRRELERLRDLPGTLALYESPFRIERLLGELAELLPNRPVVLARELTKKFEEFLRGTPESLLAKTRGKSWKGELTVLVGPANDANGSPNAAVEQGGAVTLPSVRPPPPVPGPSVRLVLAQMRVEPGQPEVNLACAESEIRQAAEQGGEIVLLPEVLDFGWTHPSARDAAGGVPDGASFGRLARAAARHRIYVCAGLAERCGEKLFNAAVLISPDGDLLLHHRKIHEIPFARALYATGDRLGVVDTPLGRLGLMICADALAPGLVVTRSLAAMGADLILSPCAWAVPPDAESTRVPYGNLWRDHYGPVAQEHGLWIAGCSNVGPVLEGEWKGWRCIGNSMVVGPGGGELRECGYGEMSVEQLVVDVSRRNP